MKKVKADEVGLSKSPQPQSSQKLMSKKEKRSKESLQENAIRDADREQNDSFEKYYNKDLDLEEDQVPVVIYELCESAVNFISQESFEKGLILLQKAQTMLEQIQAQSNPHDQFVFLLVMHNMALCYQKLGVLDECASCLEKCLKYLKSEKIKEYFNDVANPGLRLKLLKYECKTHMQVCALFSQIHKHREAAFHANESVQISHFLIHDAENLCTYFTKELIQNKPLAEVSIIGNTHYGLIQKTAVKLLPVFQAILKKVAIEDEYPFEESGVPITGPLTKNHHTLEKRLDKKQTIKMAQEKSNSRIGSGLYLDVGEPDMKNILGYLNQNEWIYSLNIGNIMQVAPLTLQDFMSSNSLQIELTREYVLEKICFLCVSYFCLGTEFRFLHQQNEVIQGVTYQRKDSEFWHGKAVELSISFLPSESPLVSHVIMSYEKHHSPSNLPIPEDNTQDVKVRVVRQLAGIDSSRIQPIIRYHPETDYRVKFISIKPMDYHEIFSYSANEAHQRRTRNQEFRQSSSSIGRQQQNIMRRSIQSQSGSHTKFAQNKARNTYADDARVVDIEDSYSKPGVSGVISPLSDNLPAPIAQNQRQKSRSPTKGNIDAGRVQPIEAQERQNQSEVGISQKHRKLQASDLQRILQNSRPIESQIDLPKEKEMDDEQRIFMQERRAKSSLSNRHGNQKQKTIPQDDEIFQPEEGTLSSNLLAFNANLQRQTINQESASNKNQRLIVEQLEETRALHQRQRINSSHKRRDSGGALEQTELEDADELAQVAQQIRNSRTELSHQRSNTIGTSIEMQHKRQQLASQGPHSSQHQKPITDVRNKRQSNNTIPAASVSNLDDISLIQDNRQSAQLVPHLHGHKKKGAQDRANIASHLNQQMLLQHMMQAQAVQQQSGSRGSQNQLMHQLPLSQTQKVSVPSAVQQVQKSRRTAGNSGQKKSAKSGINSVLTNDQLVFMMQQKRDRLNQSQLVGGTAYQKQIEEMQQQSMNATQPTSGQILNLNKLYQSHRKTPTSLQSDLTKYQTAQPQQSNQITQKPTKSSVKQALIAGQEQKRAQSQLAQSLQIDDVHKQQGLPNNRKASVENRIGQIYNTGQQSEVKVTASALPSNKNSRR